MCVVLLVSAGLLVRTFVQLKSLQPGFDPDSVVAATISLQDARYRDPGKVARLFEDSLIRIRRYPGVEAAGVTRARSSPFLSVGLTLLTVAFLSSIVPALRVLRVDPALTLRAE
jgi:hypothetical protein